MDDPHRRTTIRLAIARQRDTEDEERRQRQRYGPGPIHLSLVIAAGALAMLLWLVLAFNLGSHGGDPATYTHAVLVSFAVIPAIGCLQAIASYHAEKRAARRHDEVIVIADALRLQLASQDANLDPESAAAVRRISLRLLNGTDD
ncbi:hypothetical protein [Micromonospora rubida]|uniref:hypothetical protein n=1 Tax=Micromonospora rubida TaxID=2697657 RepID=UPI001378412D|nr:hypothetical protein [Micromonospora rubida]NBE80279.1 hypothetical protein [Micromonospora rubida]